MMPRSHPAAWGGLVINAILVFFLYMVSASLDPANLPEDQKFVAELIQKSLPVLVTVLVVQLAGLYLVATGKKAGLGLVALGTFFMLPISLIYGIGCLYTYFGKTSEAIPRTKTLPNQPEYTFASVYPFWFFLGGCSFALAAWLSFETGQSDTGIIAMSFSFTSMFFGARAKDTPALALYAQGISVAPNLFGPQLFLPFENLQSARLHQDKRIEFSLYLNAARHTVTWNMKQVRPGDQKAALEELARKLRAHNVALL